MAHHGQEVGLGVVGFLGPFLLDGIFLGQGDRFVTASIPVTENDPGEPGTEIIVNRTRLNFDWRMTEVGLEVLNADDSLPMWCAVPASRKSG